MKKTTITSIFCLFGYITYAQTTTGSACPPPANPITVGKTIPTTTPFVPDNTSTNNPPQNTPANTGDRLVYWVHGIGGDHTTWQKAATAVEHGAYYDDGTSDPSFKARTITSKRELDYDESSNDMPSAASDLNSLIQGFSVQKYGIDPAIDRTSDFIIAHSQGGLVSRFLDKEIAKTASSFLPRTFGGIVTFGTPHQGAAIIGNISTTNKLNDFVNYACTALTSGPLSESFETNFIVNLFNLNPKIVDFTCSTIGNTVAAFGKLKTAALGQAYYPSTPFLNELNSASNITTTPKVAFYGVEDKDGICFRTLYSFSTGDANTVGGYFHGETTDPLALKAANDMLNIYIGKRNAYRGLAEDNKPTWKDLLNPLLDVTLRKKARYDSYSKTRNLYQDGVDFFSNADMKYEDVIGALTVTPPTSDTKYVTSCDCTPPIHLGDGGGTGISIVANNPPSASLKQKYSVPTTGDPADVQVGCQGPNCRIVGYYVTTYTPGKTTIADSDGIVLASSASNFPGCYEKYKIKMPSSNHNQMKNDANTKKGLNALFDGAYGNYFKTDVRHP